MFDPKGQLTQLKGKDYLEVKWRVHWFRSEHPDGIITTEVLEHDKDTGFCLCRAHVIIPGAGEAIAHGSETKKDFFDYIEKAETKGIGRALALLGYGTQFCQDLEFSSEEHPDKVVDSPVGSRTPVLPPDKPQVSVADTSKEVVTEKNVAWLKKEIQRAGAPGAKLAAKYGALNRLTLERAGELVKELKALDQPSSATEGEENG